MKKFVRTCVLLLSMAMLLLQLPGTAVGAVDATEELRGVWIASVYNIDFPSAPGLSSSQQKEELDAIVNNAKKMGLNAIFFQVRPSGDALYPSEYFPWAASLTGRQGKANSGNFDPLAYIIDKAHEEGIQLHAWINPLRITAANASNPKQDLNELSEDNFARQHPEYVVAPADGMLYYDPGYPEVREHILNGIEEILNNYDVDGIHFDDYFYPSSVIDSFDDSASYKAYGQDFGDIGDWRRDNINQLIYEAHRLVEKKGHGAVFGVSPSPLWANAKQMEGGLPVGSNFSTYSGQYADTKRWVEEEWLDYIAPQVYWNIGYAPADYKTIVQWWSDVTRKHDVDLYVGHAAYKIGDNSQSDAWLDPQEIPRQLQVNEEIGGVDGDIYYGYSNLKANKLGIADTLASLYADGDSQETVNPDDGNTEEDNTDHFPDSDETTDVIMQDSLMPSGARSEDSGEVITFSCKAPAGADRVWVRLGPYEIDLAREEEDRDKTGTQVASFTGSFTLPEINVNKDSIDYGAPVFLCKYQGNYTSATTGGSIVVRKAEQEVRIATVTDLMAATRLGPGTSYDRGTPLARGAQDIIVSESNNFYKLRSGIYVPASSVSVSTVMREQMDNNYISDIEYVERDKFTDIVFHMDQASPYSLRWSGTTVTLSIHNVNGRKAPSVPDNRAITNVTYKQISSTVAQYTIELGTGFYGFDASYKDGNLTFSLKCPPMEGSAGSPLENVTVYLDAGHGGTDPGATSVVDGMPNEKDITLAVVKQLKDKLEAQGATVVTTRLDDSTVVLTDRPNMIKTAGADISISIHVNSVTRTGDYQKANGLEVLYTKSFSRTTAEFYQNALIKALGRTNRGAKEQSLAVCRIEQNPAILIETGFITNPDDYQWLISTEGQAQLTQAITDATIAWVKAQN